MPHTQVGISTALVDAEQHLTGVDAVGLLIQPLMLGNAALQPAVGTLAGGLHILVRSGILHALVKSHGNVAAQVGLDLHRLLRTHKNPVAVDVGGEGHALLLDLPQAGQGEHLKSAAVGEHGAIPAHHLMQAAQLLHHLVAGTQVQMIGIGQLHLTADLLQVKGGYRALDGTLGADVHKYRGLHSAVWASKHAASGAALGFDHFKHNKTPSCDGFNVPKGVWSLCFYYFTAGTRSCQIAKRKGAVQKPVPLQIGTILWNYKCVFK